MLALWSVDEHSSDFGFRIDSYEAAPLSRRQAPQFTFAARGSKIAVRLAKKQYVVNRLTTQ